MEKGVCYKGEYTVLMTMVLALAASLAGSPTKVEALEAKYPLPPLVQPPKNALWLECKGSLTLQIIDPVDTQRNETKTSSRVAIMVVNEQSGQLYQFDEERGGFHGFCIGCKIAIKPNVISWMDVNGSRDGEYYSSSSTYGKIDRVAGSMTDLLEMQVLRNAKSMSMDRYNWTYPVCRKVNPQSYKLPTRQF